MVKVKRALISVFDKKNLDFFVKGLDRLGIEIISTGGTARFIEGLGVNVKEVSKYTGFPEILDGRVKTLHPKIHGALLFIRDNPAHIKQIKEHNIEPIDMLVVNLYPFEQTIKKSDVSIKEAIENIDIGGPTMLRSAAKNFKSVAVVCDPNRYEEILKELMENNHTLNTDICKKLALEVFEHTAYYDALIAQYIRQNLLSDDSDKIFPELFTLGLRRSQYLRYGENPHQKAVYYKFPVRVNPGVSTAIQLSGKELSFNNILDLDAAFTIVSEFDEPAVSIIKHNNPCGVACADTLKKAFKDALNTDRVSAFGSIVGANQRVDVDTAKTILKEADFVECIIAPSYEEKALEVLRSRRNLRILEVPNLDIENISNNLSGELDIKKVSGGILIQEIDRGQISEEDLKVVTKTRPTKAQFKSLIFGFKVVKFVKSNAIVLTKGTKTVGIGAGQMSRVDSVFIATKKAGKSAIGSCLASDAFFPKPDSIFVAKRAGIRAIIQPGGSIQDNEVIKAANRCGIAMVFTGQRHFRH